MSDPFGGDIIKTVAIRRGLPGESADAVRMAAIEDRLTALEAMRLQRATGTGLYYGPMTSMTGWGPSLVSTNISANRLFSAPWIVHQDTPCDRAGIEVTTAVPGATIRLGLYASDGTGLTGTRLFDFGTVDASATGWREVVIDVDIPAGFHWLACAASVAGVWVQCIPVSNGTTVFIGYLGNVGGIPVSTGRRQTDLTPGFTSLPTPFGVNQVTSVLPAIQMRVG